MLPASFVVTSEQPPCIQLEITPVQARSDMRFAPLMLGLIGVAALSGCTGGVLDPKGPISLEERQILINSTGIMLVIVIPTVLATLGVAFWFRASNKRARY